jgi:hypothetical protein
MQIYTCTSGEYDAEEEECSLEECSLEEELALSSTFPSSVSLIISSVLFTTACKNSYRPLAFNLLKTMIIFMNKSLGHICMYISIYGYMCADIEII